ncbi:hypothetical protein IAQ61_002567 [Plenodomus lingam]|uniref:uncharacterized protein n=1 Tax=Leptosphaeria maculans TaxID=5022 RepID=UPI00331D360B|nr:hypothetical protein IAQ61_002567 [Plenodomus lingam]
MQGAAEGLLIANIAMNNGWALKSAHVNMSIKKRCQNLNANEHFPGTVVKLTSINNPELLAGTAISQGRNES